MRRLWTLTAATLLAVVAATGSIARPADASAAKASPLPTYDAIALGTLGGAWSQATAINNRDEVVGVSETATRRLHPFLWRSGTMIDLGELPGSLSGFGVAQDVNDLGQVVGAASDADGFLHGFLWEEGVMTDLGVLSGPDSIAWAINNQGQIVGQGSVQLPDGSLRRTGVLWQAGLISGLGLNNAWDINNRGQIVGDAPVAPEVRHAALWERGQVTDLATIFPKYSDAAAINDRGWIGINGSGTSLNQAFLWRSGVLTPLGTLGGTSTWVLAVNDRGQVLGRGETASGQDHGFIWQDGRLVDLTTRGVPPQTAASGVDDMNDLGHLAGTVQIGPGESHAALFRER